MSCWAQLRRSYCSGGSRGSRGAGSGLWSKRVSRAFVVYGVIYLVAALVVDLPARFEALARLQPLRSLHFLYIVMFVVMGGFLAEYVLKDRVWRWLLLFAPLSLGMFLGQRALFPASAQVEWPGAAPKNPWAQAFVWIRQNTPVNAVFALDPEYMDLAGEDEIGFRCLAERSRLADGVKDNGVVSMFPPLAEEWWAQVQAQTPWKSFRAEDFLRLKNTYGVSWMVVQQPGSCRARLRLPEQRGARLPDSLKVLATSIPSSVCNPKSALGIADRIQFQS